MSLSRDLKVEIAGDATKLLSSVDAAERKLVSLGTTSSTTSDKILSSNRKLDDSFAATAKAQAAASDVMVASDAKVIASAEKTGGALQTIHKHALAGTAAVAGLFGGYEAAKSAISSTIDLAKETAILSTSTGASVTQSSQLVAVMQSLGVNTTQAGQSIKALSKANEAQITSTGTTVTAFDKLGISQQEAVAHSHDYVGLLELVADRLKTVRAGTEKTTLLQQLFGKSYQTIEPLIRNGSKGLQDALAVADKYGVTLTSKTLPGVLALAKAEREHSEAMLGLKVAFTEVAGKPMIDFEDHLTNIANDIRSSNWGDLSKQTTELGSGLEKVIQKVTPEVANAFGQAAPKMLAGLWSGFEHADIGGEVIIGALVAKKVFSTAIFAEQGLSAGKKFFEKLGVISSAAAPAEGAVAGREFAGAFDAAAAEGLAGAGVIGAGGELAAGGALATAAKTLGSAIGKTLAIGAGLYLGSELQSSLPGEGGLSAAPGEGIGGGRVAPGALNGNVPTRAQGAITGWAQSQIGHDAESTGANTGPELDQLQAQFHTTAAAWCAEFATTAAMMGGANQAVRTASVNTIQTWAQQGSHGYQKGLASKPMVGDLAILDNGGHVGFVTGVNENAGTVTTIEGNTNVGNGAVRQMTEKIQPGSYARPVYGTPGPRSIGAVGSGKSISGSGSSAGALKACLLTYYDPRKGGINIADPKHPYALANGDTWKPSMMGCAAPPAYAFGTQIQFVYKGRSVMATVVDRGGAIQGNHFDLQPAPAQALGMMSAGKVTAKFRIVGQSANGATNAAGQATTLADTQSADFSAYQQATSDVGLELQAGQITQGQADSQDKQIGQSALKGGFGSLDSHMLLQVKADIAGATSGTAALAAIETAAQKRVLTAGHGMASKESALVSKYSTAVAKAITAQQHTESLQALFPTDLSTPAGAATAIGNLNEQKAAQSHIKDIYTDELNAIKKEIAAWVKSRDTYRKIARTAKGAAKAAALKRAAGLQANIDQGQADADTIGGNISDTDVQIKSLDVQIEQTTADAATAQAQAAQTGLDNDFSAYQQATSDIQLQVDAGVLTPAQGTAATLAAGQKALNGGFGALSQQSIWQVMADMKNATQDNTTALDANTQATLDATKAQLQFAQAANAISNIETQVAIKALADLISGQIVGVDYSGRSGTAGSGMAARY